MTIFLAILKAIFTRLVFASHGFVAIWQATTFKRNPLYWYLCCPIIMLFFEGIFTMTIKENQEWKWFCPSVFLYLCSTVPSIWLLELDKINRRVKARESNFNNFTDNFDLTNLATEDLKHLQKTLGVNIKLPDIQISAETWVTLIEQFLMLILIIGRWMLPKGDLTRDQLSQLLLVYIGTAADIIEFFDSFKEDRISREPLLVYLTLGIWTWSLMQFTVVLTATKSRKSRLSANNPVKKKAQETSCCTIDVWGIALNMLLQDGPFLAFRLILIVEYKIVNYMNIFFTCKNTLVILLQLYRLYVVQSENKVNRKKAGGERHELPTISIISRDEIYRKSKHSSGRESRKKKKKKYIKDVEEGFSESGNSSEEVDDYDSGPLENSKKNTRFKKSRQDTGYSTSGSRISLKQPSVKKSSKHSKSSKKFELKSDDSSEEETTTKRSDKHFEINKGKLNKKSRKRTQRDTETESSSEESDSSESIIKITDLEVEHKIRQKQRKRYEDRQ